MRRKVEKEKRIKNKERRIIQKRRQLLGSIFHYSIFFILYSLSLEEAFLVGVAGFEPAASWTRTMRDTKLRHTPIA